MAKVLYWKKLSEWRQYSRIKSGLQMKVAKNSSGFTVWELLIALVLLFFVGLAGWYVLSNDTSTKQAMTAEESAAKSKPRSQKPETCDALSQLSEPISFTCDSNVWTNLDPNDEAKDYGFDFAAKEDDSVTLSYSASSTNSQYGAYPTTCTIIEVQELNAQNYGTLYLVKDGFKDSDDTWSYRVGLSGKKPRVDTGTDYECVPPPFNFDGKTKDKFGETVIVKVYASTTSPTRNDTTAFDSPAMQDAIRFLESVNYK